MRRFALAFLLAASLPQGTAPAVPFADYNPANGDIAFHDVASGIQIWLKSNAGNLNPFIATLPVELVPMDANPPQTINSSGARSALWVGPGFQFTTLTIRAAIEPHTPLDDLAFLFHPRNALLPQVAPIVSVPEPSAVAFAAWSFGIAAILHRSKARRLAFLQGSGNRG